MVLFLEVNYTVSHEIENNHSWKKAKSQITFSSPQRATLLGRFLLPQTKVS